MSIHLIIGPMWSGKTTELLRRMKRHAAAGLSFEVVTTKMDDRYHRDTISSHDGDKCAANYSVTSISGIEFKTKYVFIDEGALIPDLAEGVLANPHITFHIAALNGTFMQTMFEPVAKIFPFATDVQWLTSICDLCKSEGATFHHRTAPSKDVILIGGKDSYNVLCRNCFNIITHSEKKQPHAHSSSRAHSLPYSSTLLPPRLIKTLPDGSFVEDKELTSGLPSRKDS